MMAKVNIIHINPEDIMRNHTNLLLGLFSIMLCLMVVFSILTACQILCETDPDQNPLLTHPENAIAPAAVYEQDTAMLLTLTVLLMMAAHTLLNRNKHLILQTARAAGVILISLALTVGVTWACHPLFPDTAVPAGLAALSMTALTVSLATRWTTLTCRDLNRAFAYLHGLLSAALTVLLPRASFFFTASALMLMFIQLLITFKRKALDWGLELLATALYIPIIMAVLRQTAAPVSGLLFALGIFPVGVFGVSACGRVFRHRRLSSFTAGS